MSVNTCQRRSVPAHGAAQAAKDCAKSATLAAGAAADQDGAATKGEGRRGTLEREEDDRRRRGYGARAPAEADALGWPHLIALGVGAIVGTGILTLTGVGAAKAGPAVILSFAIAGLICAAAALAYAEMATMYPGLGQRLYLHLCRARRTARLDRRLEPDPRIFAGGERGRGRLVGLCLAACSQAWAGLPARA